MLYNTFMLIKKFSIWRLKNTHLELDAHAYESY